jgi:hypothetical protein
MLAVLLAFMRYEKAQQGATRCAPARRVAVSASAKMHSALSRGNVAALGLARRSFSEGGYIVYEVVKAYGSLSTALAPQHAAVGFATGACGREGGPGEGRGDRGGPCCGCEEGGLRRLERAEPKGSAR